MKDTGEIHRWNPRIMLRYALFQLPALFLITLTYLLIIQYRHIDIRLFLLFLALWISKDIIFYPFVWKSYVVRHHSPGEILVGKTGYALESLNPEGYIRVNGELWKAIASPEAEAIAKGERVVVHSCRDNRLLVKHSDRQTGEQVLKQPPSTL